jgi:BirA family biotin operon repressor/biotin-[acetyl-CoA-carboxylase] ligase
MAAGLAACDGVEAAAGFRPQLKWPNDLVVGDRKLAGLLTESTPGEVTAVILGLGVNVTAAAYPADLSEAATSCEEEAKGPVDRAELLVAVLTALEARYSAVLVKGGRETTMEAYRADSATIGRRVRVELPTGILDGTADRVAWNGQLIVVDDNGGQHVVNAGDVIHLRT